MTAPLDQQAENISPTIFADTLRALMQEREVTQVQLADQAGVTQASVSGWLQGSIPKGDVLYRLARCLRVSMEYLLTGQHPAPRQSQTQRLGRSPAEAQRLAAEALAAAQALSRELQKF